MGNIGRGFFDGFSGRLGNVVGYQWRGRMCVRSMPSHYSDARTPEQLRQRALFKAVVGFAARARQVLDTGLRQVSLDAQMTESNYFMRVNKRCFSMMASGDPSAGQGELAIDYENLLLADGPVAPVRFYDLQMVDEATLRVDFEKNPLHRTVRSEDLVYLAAYCPELGAFDLSLPAYRRSNAVAISLNPYWIGREVHLWGFVADGKGRASQSQYLGSGVLELDGIGASASDDDSADVLPEPRFVAGGRIVGSSCDADSGDFVGDAYSSDSLSDGFS